MNLLERIRTGRTEQRYSFDEYISDASTFMYQGLAYQGLNQTWDSNRPVEKGDGTFESRVQGLYKRNGVIFACQLARLLLFTEARFMWQALKGGRPQDLFWTPDLLILEQPWFSGSTGNLLARMIQDVDISGNAFVRRTLSTANTPALERLRPDWTTVLLGSDSDFVNAQVIGYAYEPGGPGSKEKLRIFERSEVAHWSPIPDPTASYRGMSWMSPILRDLRSDALATEHKVRFFENAATPNMIIKFDPATTFETFQKFKTEMEAEHRGAWNAYKTLYLGGGADATTVGLNFEQMDFKNVQGAQETRIAAAAGVPPVIVGLSEGLQAATYSNYAQARRRFADMTIRPLWRDACAALSTIIPAPREAARLWFDDRDIPALQEDEKDAAAIEQVKATTIATLVRDGFEPGSVVNAVMAEDLSLLTHTGALSVQLIKPGSPNGVAPTPASEEVPA